MTFIQQMAGLRGESFADVARRTGQISGQPVAPAATDQEVLDAIAPAAGAIAENAATRAEAALASILSDPNADELDTTDTREVTDKVIVIREGVPYLYTGPQIQVDADGAFIIGTSGVNNSFNSSLVISRALNLAATGDNGHDVSISTQITDLGGFAYAGLDNRINVLAGDGNHIVFGLQSVGQWNSPGTLTDGYGWFDQLTMTDGRATRVTGANLMFPALSGDAAVDQYRAIYVGPMPEYNGTPTTATTNYAWMHVGSGRMDHNGPGRFKRLRIADNDGEKIEALTLEIEGSAPGKIYIGESGIWNWRLGMNQGATPFRIEGNGTLAYSITAVTNHLLPGADGTQDLGDASHRFDNSFFAVASTIGSDARLKRARGPLTGPELDWAAAIEPLAYQLHEAIARNGREALLAELGEEDTGQKLDSAAVKRRGRELARMHIGVLAQQVHAAGVAAGIEDPFTYAFLCRDPKLVRVRKVRTVQRQATEQIAMERKLVETDNNAPVIRTRTIIETVPLCDPVQAKNEDGSPATIDGRAILVPKIDPATGRQTRDRRGALEFIQAKDEAGRPLYEQVPWIVDVPRLETVKEPYFVEEVARDRAGNPDYYWSIRYEELLMFLFAALRERVRVLETRIPTTH